MKRTGFAYVCADSGDEENASKSRTTSRKEYTIVNAICSEHTSRKANTILCIPSIEHSPSAVFGVEPATAPDDAVAANKKSKPSMINTTGAIFFFRAARPSGASDSWYWATAGAPDWGEGSGSYSSRLFLAREISCSIVSRMWSSRELLNVVAVVDVVEVDVVWLVLSGVAASRGNPLAGLADAAGVSPLLLLLPPTPLALYP